jgi:quercetin 2,3-dioxygenase
MTIQIRRADERGKADYGWLKTSYSFSFSEYYDPNFMGFGPLRVINDDYIAGGGGFPTHPHKNMEIITYVLDGALEHKDSLGNGSVINAQDVQYMCAGTGIRHSEFNPSPSETCHLLQIWILPDKNGHIPNYGQAKFTQEDKKGKLCLIASNDGRENSIAIHQRLNLYASIFDNDDQIIHKIAKTNGIWIQMAKGRLFVNDIELFEGDGLAIWEEELLTIRANGKSEFLLFDMG